MCVHYTNERLKTHFSNTLLQFYFFVVFDFECKNTFSFFIFYCVVILFGVLLAYCFTSAEFWNGYFSSMWLVFVVFRVYIIACLRAKKSSFLKMLNKNFKLVDTKLKKIVENFLCVSFSFNGKRVLLGSIYISVNMLIAWDNFLLFLCYLC